MMSKTLEENKIDYGYYIYIWFIVDILTLS